MPIKDRNKYKNLNITDCILAQQELRQRGYEFNVISHKSKYGLLPLHDIEILDKKEIKVGSHIRTNKEYENKIYESLYHEKILDAVVLDIDENDIVTYKLMESSCDFTKRFNYHMNSWKVGTIKTIGLGWLELKED